MKKLLLVTGIFMSISLFASAQEKKSATAAPATSTQMAKKKDMNQMKKEKTAKKMEAEKMNKNAANVKKGTTKPAAAETLTNQ